MANAEISHVKQILGLQHGKEYTDVKSLRYGQLMIMTDQDHDGSHIKGLLINFLHAHFPSLLKVPNFLVEFITPIIKATKGKSRQIFYTMPEYETWKESLGAAGSKGWAIKYYKGLGTSTAAEAKEYFAAMDANTKAFKWGSEEDGTLIDMAFSRKKVEDRKRWLRAFKPGTFLDHAAPVVRYDDFINRELILFSLADLQRSIPSVMDGLKPSQRKVMFACFKRKLRSDIKVAQLSGYVSEHSAYHHGEASLASTIVGLAQDFVGANNVNLLVPSGQFGTRLQGGKDHASPRYIFTRLAALARALFPEADDALLRHLYDDGQRIEPEFYLPVLPLLLVNGADGIGTGWSTSVPNYNPLDIVANLKRMLDGEEPAKMHPWYRGFKGVIAPAPDSKAGERAYTVTGIVRVLDDTTIEVSELPLQSWTQDYKEFLESLARPEKKEDIPFITDYKEYHTDVSVRFVITLPAENLVAAIESGLEKKFKLTSRISTSNMHAFDSDGRITKYESPEAVMQTFFAPRLDAYARRREALLAAAGSELTRLDNKVRFIMSVVDGKLVIAKRKRAELEAELRRGGFDPLPKGGKAAAAAAEAAAADDDGEDGAAAAVADAGVSYDYLLSLPLWSLTLEKVAELTAERGAKAAEVARLQGTTPSELWRFDLDAFAATYAAAEAEAAREQELLVRQQGSFKAGRKPAAKKATVYTIDDDEDDFEMEDDDDDDDFGAAAKKKKAAAAAKKKAAAAAGSAAPPPPTTAKPCAAADLFAAAQARAAAAAAAALLAPPKPPRAPKADTAALCGALEAIDLMDDDGTAAPKPAPRKRAPAGTAKPRVAKPKKEKAMSDSDDDGAAGGGGSDDDEEDMMCMSLAERLALRGGPAAPKCAAAAKASAAFVDLTGGDSDGGGSDDGSDAFESDASDSESDFDDDDDDAPKKKKPAAKPAAKPAPAPKPAPKAAAAAPKPKAAAAPRAKKAAVIEISDSEGDVGSDSESDFEDDSPKPKKKAAAPKPKAAAAPKTAAGEAAARKRVLSKAPKAAAASPGASEGPTPAPKKACRKRPAKKGSDDDEDEEDDDAPAPRAAAARPGRAAAPKSYAQYADSDEDEEEASDFDGDSD
jgi:DNA topoisomerase-2